MARPPSTQTYKNLQYIIHTLLQWEHWKLGFKLVYPNGLTQHVLLSVALEKAYHFASDSGK